MSHIEDTDTREILEEGGRPPSRSGQSAHLKPLRSDDDDDSDSQEYARLLDLYDTSFRNIAEGEVVKGTVLKVTENEVVVDVGFKSEGIVRSTSSPTKPDRSPSSPATSSTCCSSAPKTAMVMSSSRAKKPRR